MTKEMLLSLHKNGLPIDVVIDTLIDEYESRTCENCKHGFYISTIGVDCKEDIHQHQYKRVNDNTFGCLKWEPKDD